jgi:uncharacterized protein YceK
MKKFGVLVVIATICLLVAGCSTVPKHGSFDYDILGYVDNVSYGSYEAALEAAKKAYPQANGVVFVSAIGANNIIPFPVKVGNWAIKYTKGTH